ncbi:MAG: type IV pilus modification protein PilV [Lysobacteraceae bacterium]|nr:MAG: type IV pilus modification protein PilV [Xanthomonadaceae bacterium]
MLTGRRVHRGTSLIEVLVSLLLLSLGLLSVAGLQVRLAVQTGAVQYRAVASQLALDFSERLRANAPGVAAGAYDAGVPAAPASTAAAVAGEGVPRQCVDACGPAELALADLQSWRSAAAAQLPEGQLWVVRDSASQPMVVEVWVAWRPAATGALLDDTQLLGACAAPMPAGIDCLQLRHTL